MDKSEIRLRIVEVMVPQATRVGVLEPEYIVKSCSQLEEYVLGVKETGEESDSPTTRKRRKPKGTTSETESST